jgi:hypothetical protein
MAKPFNDVVNNTGLIQSCEMKLFGDDGLGKISGNATRLSMFTARINSAFDDFVKMAISADGKWEWDDSNNSDFPIATTPLIANQRDYIFTVDMMEITKVAVLNAQNGVWIEIMPLDIQDQMARPYIENNLNNVGVPYFYAKTANSIILQPRPNYAASIDSAGLPGGLKVFFKRGANYFVSNDTTKVPGFNGTFHDYLALNASEGYALDNTLEVAESLTGRRQAAEVSIIDFFSSRDQDTQKIIKPTFKQNR